MSRVSRAEAAHHREQVVTAASGLFRERGVDSVSLAELMAVVGLTHGGFYRQFASKDALAAEATTAAFDEWTASLREMAERNAKAPVRRWRELVDTYLSAQHRDGPASGCPVTALGSEVAHEAPDSPVRAAYAAGVQDSVDVLSCFDGQASTRDEQIATLCTLVGALTLARATAGDPLSDEILRAAKAHLTAAGPPSRVRESV
jgi:TetR/AcrR family transcriptional regulator, transcriptional repressor for nem operon